MKNPESNIPRLIKAVGINALTIFLLIVCFPVVLLGEMSLTRSWRTRIMSVTMGWILIPIWLFVLYRWVYLGCLGLER